MLQEAPSPLALFHALSIPYELRRSFMPLTSAHVAVVQALMDAAQAHVQGDVVLANALFTQADEPSMADYVLRIIGKIDVVIHRQARTPEAALLIAKALQAGMPSSVEQQQIFERDGWHCRCCGVPVVCSRARTRLSACYTAVRWGKRNVERHAGIFALMASLDHALPRSRGGGNEASNLLTVCWPCQFGRMDWTYEEVQMADPRVCPVHPRLAGWKGLTQCR
jgi:hypothetical protein